MTATDPPAAADAAPPDGGRDYLFAALAALLVLALILLSRSGGNPLPAVALVPALLALAVRAPILPAVTVALVCYFAVFPDGVPRAPLRPLSVTEAHFRVVDLAGVAAVVAYFVAAFRREAYTRRAFPASAGLPDPPPRRAGPVPGDEFARGIGRAIALTFAAAVAWQFLGVLTVDPLGVPPVRLQLGDGSGRGSRFLILGGAVALGGLVLTLLTGYWAAAAMRPAAARQYLLDLGWRESRRELNRQEKWRAWGRARPARVRWRGRSFAKALALVAATVLAAAVGAAVLRLILTAAYGPVT